MDERENPDDVTPPTAGTPPTADAPPTAAFAPPTADIVENGDARARSWPRWAGPVGLLAAGGLIGGVLAATLSAGAAPSPSPSPTSPSAPQYGMPWHDRHGGPGGPGFRGMLDHTGTVTKVGTNSVTIKSGSTATTYAVTSNSDIDKNGEAKLSDLKVGDAVRFSVVTVNGKATIGILHSGNEALNMPKHGPGDHDGDGDHRPGAPASPAPNGSGSSTGYSNA
jgi:hypothetical protein